MLVSQKTNMTRVLDRRKALFLRKQGKTYSEIKKDLGVSKSTLSDWLHAVPLNQTQLNLVQKSRLKAREVAIEKTRITKLEKRALRLKQVYIKEQDYFLPLSHKELLLAGLFLYWGEGGKHMQGAISLNNTDPAVIKFTLYWLRHAFLIPKDKIKVGLHLYSDMNPKKEIRYWSQILKIPSNQFGQPYIKKTKRIDIDQKGYGHGTCVLRIGNVRLKEKIMMGIKAISDYYSEKI